MEGTRSTHRADTILTEPSAGEEPSPAELAAIEAEWPLIAAELAALDAEIAALTSSSVSELDVRRTRRARRRVLRASSTLVRLSWDGEAA